MGNEVSKVKRASRADLPQQITEKRSHRSLVPPIASLDQQPHRLERQHTEPPKLTPGHAPPDDEATILRRQLLELEKRHGAEADERRNHAEGQQTQWERSIEETQAQRRVIELRTQERDAAHQALTKFEEDVKAMQAQFKVLEDKRKEADEVAEGKRKYLEERVAEAERNAESSKTELSGAQQRVEDLEKQKAQLSDKLASVKASHATAIEAAGQEKGSMEARLQQALDRIRSLEQAEVTTREDSSASRVQAAAELENMQSQLRDAVSRVEASEAAKSALKDELANTKAATNEQLPKLTADVQALEVKNRALINDLTAVKAEATAQLSEAKEQARIQLSEVRAPPSPAGSEAPSRATTPMPPSLDTTSSTEELASLKVDLAASEAKIEELRQQYQQLSPVSSPVHTLRKMASYRNEFSEPVKFTQSAYEDLRVGIDKRDGEVRVDVREWFGGARTRRGVGMLVEDAQQLVKLLPHLVRKAEFEVSEIERKSRENSPEP